MWALLFAHAAAVMLSANSTALTRRAPPAPGAPLAWSWTRLLTSGVKPAARAGHAALEVDGKVFMIGGCIMDIQCFNDVHVFDPATTTWSGLSLVGDAPEPRGGHSATQVGASVWVFGGASSEETFRDVYELDLIARRWVRGTPTRSHGKPTARTNHAADTDGSGRVFLFGGYSAQGQYLDDLWVLDVFYDGDWVDDSTVPVVWQQPVTVGRAPLAREGHSLTVIQGRAYVFGGYTVSGLQRADLHVLALDSMSWVPPTLVDPMPAPRQNHAAVRHGNKLLLVGGCTVEHPPHCFSDAWSLDTTSLSWTARSWDQTTLTPREGHSATMVRGDLLVVAGCDLGKCYNDVASLSTGDPCPSDCGGHGSCEVEASTAHEASSSFCQCGSGFGGHDCQTAVQCPFGCHGVGQCQPTGRCTCNNGFGGPSCQLRFPCPTGPSSEDVDGAPCAGQGKCLASGKCECYLGFLGEDCAQGSSSCPNNCGGHGKCSPESKCHCDVGWHGDGCDKPDTCPLGCCKHGACGEDQCLCQKGWHGPACNLADAAWALLGELSGSHAAELRQDAKAKRQQAHDDLQVAQLLEDSVGRAGSPEAQAKAATLKLTAQQMLADVADLEKAAAAAEADRTQGGPHALADLSTCSPEINAAVGNSAPGSPVGLVGLGGRRQAPTAAPHLLAAFEGKIQHLPGAKVPKLGREAFGVSGGNDVESAEETEAQCPGLENCNFHGICRDNVCYCEPSFYGEKCNHSTETQKDTLPLETVLVIAAGTVISSFVLTWAYLQYVAYTRRAKEMEMGFNI